MDSTERRGMVHSVSSVRIDSQMDSREVSVEGVGDDPGGGIVSSIRVLSKEAFWWAHCPLLTPNRLGAGSIDEREDDGRPSEMDA